MFRPRNPDRPHEGDADFAVILSHGFSVRLAAYGGERCIRATALDKHGQPYVSAHGFSVPGALAALRRQVVAWRRVDEINAKTKAAKAQAEASPS